MLNSKIRHWLVALGLVAAVGITAASAAGHVRTAQRALPAPQAMPVISGDLGEVVVVAPHDLGEIVVRAPHDLGDVLVEVRPLPPAGAYVAKVVVTAPRFVQGSFGADGTVAALAAAR